MASFGSEAQPPPVDVFTVSVDAGNGSGIQVFDRVFWTASEANAAARMFFDNWAQSHGAQDWENGLTNGGQFSKGENAGNAFWEGQVHGNKVKVEVLRNPIPQDLGAHQDVEQEATAALNFGQDTGLMAPILPDATELADFAEAAAAAVERSTFPPGAQHHIPNVQTSGLEAAVQNNGGTSPNSLRRKAETLLSESPESKKARTAGPTGNGLLSSGSALTSPQGTSRKRPARPYTERLYTTTPGNPNAFRPFAYSAQLPPSPSVTPHIEGMLQVWNWSLKGYGETIELATLGCHAHCKLKYINTLTTKALVIRNFLQAHDLNFMEITHNFMINNVQPACDEFRKLSEGKASKIKFYVSKMEHKCTFFYDDLEDDEIKAGWAWMKRGPTGAKEKVNLRRPIGSEPEDEDAEGEPDKPETEISEQQQDPSATLVQQTQASIAVEQQT